MMIKSSHIRDILEEKGFLTNSQVCYNCSTCVNVCPSSLFTEGKYNPRAIIQLSSSPLSDKLIYDKNPNVWECTMCEACHEECPQGVHLHEILLLVKNVCAEFGELTETHSDQANALCKYGKAIPSSKAIERRRESLGLDQVLKTDSKEIRELIKLSKIMRMNVSCPAVKESKKEEK